MFDNTTSMSCINLTKLIAWFLIVVAFSSCDHSGNSREKERVVLEKQNELLRKENELLKKEQELNKKLSDTTQNQLSVQTKFDNSKPNRLGGLKKLNGMSPFEAKLFDNSAFGNRLKKLLGARYDFLKENWTVATPIELTDNTFVAWGCKAHFCDLTNFIVVYDFSSDVMYAGIRDEDNVKTYSEDGATSLRIIEWANEASDEHLQTDHSNNSSSSKFYLGEELNPNTQNFRLLGISSETNVSTYQYIGEITDKYFYGRKIDDIVVGIKNGKIATTIYNLIPQEDDIGVPDAIVELINKSLPFPLSYRNGAYGVNVDDMSVSLSRTNNAMTFNKDRIMFLTTVKHSILSR
jgi:hypothetical protein